MRMLVPAVLITLAACATNPPRESQQTIEQYAEALSGREIRLHLSPLPDASAQPAASSGERDPVFGYAGLQPILSPAFTLCEASQGVLQITERRSFSKTGPHLPARLLCKSGDTLLWQLGMHYMERYMVDDMHKRIVVLTPQARVSTQAENSAALPNQHKPSKAVQSPASKAKQTGARAEQRLAEPRKLPNAADLKSFRSNLKAGDRVQWKASAMPHKVTGMVLRLDGDLALVRFDKQASAEQSVRYINRAQLEPSDDVTLRERAHGR